MCGVCVIASALFRVPTIISRVRREELSVNMKRQVAIIKARVFKENIEQFINP
jgi:hypothetical protein